MLFHFLFRSLCPKRDRGTLERRFLASHRPLTTLGFLNSQSPITMDKAMDKNLICRAKLAEQAERYEDMAKLMKEFTENGSQLTSEERNLLSVAYKNVVGARRSAWRMLSSIALKSEGTDKEQYANDYRDSVVKELNDVCNEVLVASLILGLIIAIYHRNFKMLNL